MAKDESFVFTRYLYEKEEVEIQLLLSLLFKKREEALFWVFELFYSGFEMEIMGYLFKIYYYFYACLNPGFESFLIKKTKEFLKDIASDNSCKIIASIVENLLIRPFHMDVFFLYYIYHSFEISFDESFSRMSVRDIWNQLFSEKEKVFPLELFLYLVFQSNFQDPLLLLKESIDSLELEINNSKEMFLRDFKKRRENILLFPNPIDEKIILISKIVYLYGLKKKQKMGKNLYICVKKEDLVLYETITVDLEEKNYFPAYKILPIALMFEIQPDFCNLFFHLKREKQDIRDAYLNHWLYYASKSPLWSKRLQDFNGKIEDSSKKVIFEKEEWMLAFYDQYGYEPDEQKKEVQNKNLGYLEKEDFPKKKTWLSLYKEYGCKNGFIPFDLEYLEQMEPLEKGIF